MKVLIDTNVILDVLLERKPFFEFSSQILALTERDKIEGWVCATTVTTIHYLLTKTFTQEQAKEQVKTLLVLFKVARVNSTVLNDALEGKLTDFKDSVLYHSAKHENLDSIITRNEKDFIGCRLPVYNPTEFIKAIDTLI